MLQTETNLKPFESAYVILGYGLTGQALAEHFDQKNFYYWIWDDQKSLNRKSKYFLGQINKSHLNKDFIKKIKLILPSPGAPQDHPLLQWGRTQSISILSEIEWAASQLDGNFIGVTGTNGKSTTVKLIDELLRGAGLSSAIFGNYGSPLIYACAEPQFSHYVLEESSYQLEWIESLHHHIAVCLNVTDDHLDRYKTIDAYALAKENILKNSTKSDVFIYNYDNPHCLKMAKRSSAQNIPFSLVHPFETGAFLCEDKNMIIRLKGEEFIFELANCTLKGWHNIENMLAALLVCLSVKHDSKAIESYKKTLSQFKGLPHRLEFIKNENGVSFYDDSKATNVDAVAMALTSFDENIILIAGGQNKNNDFKILKGLIKQKVKLVIAIGQAQDEIYKTFSTSTEVIKKQTLEEAVQHVKQKAQSGDTVLLSPACASFDQFKNYHERGLAFQRYVKS